MADRLIIVGASGWGLEAHWVAVAMTNAGTAAWDVVGFVDDEVAAHGRSHAGLPVLGGSGDIAAHLGDAGAVFVAIGNNKPRAVLAARLEAQGLRFATLIHPKAEIAPDVEIGPGTYVGAFATIAPQARVGEHVIVNVGAVVGHEAVVADYTQIAPGAILTGACETERGAFIGSNASIYPGCRVGAEAAVGSNSFLMTNMEPRQTALGVPARQVFQR